MQRRGLQGVVWEASWGEVQEADRQEQSGRGPVDGSPVTLLSVLHPRSHYPWPSGWREVPSPPRSAPFPPLSSVLLSIC